MEIQMYLSQPILLIMVVEEMEVQEPLTQTVSGLSPKCLLRMGKVTQK